MRRILIIPILLLFSFLLISCNQDEPTLKALNNDITTYVDDVFGLPLVYDDEKDLNYSFDSSFLEIIGKKFRALQSGDTKITVSYFAHPEVSIEFKVTILKQKSISYKDSLVALTVGEELVLDLELTSLTYNEIAYDLSNEDVVSIIATNQKFKVKAVSEGFTRMTIYNVDDKNISFELNINVQPDGEIILYTSSVSLYLDESEKLPIQLKNINYEDLEFEIENPDILTIFNNYIIPESIGTTKVKITYKKNPSIHKTVTVYVEKPAYTIYDYEYWLEQLDPKYDPKALILTSEEINHLNNHILSDYSRTKVIDILTQPTTLSKTYVQGLIQNYSNINTYTVYNDGKALTSAEKQAILSNRNLENIPATINVSYGIISEFAAVRSYPTHYYSEKYYLDRFQETAFNVGDGVLIYHYSSDNKWAFVQGHNYNGWVEVSKIALCSYQEFNSFLNDPNFIIVTSERLNINNVAVRMGQRIPFTYADNDYYYLRFPTKDELGKLEIKTIQLAKTEDVHEGYLPYTIENLYKQAFKLLGIEYSWGDKLIDGRDCSSTLNSIFATFGIKMPRNTSNQSNIPNYSEKVSNLTVNDIKEKYHPGTFTFSPGHVLMYLGEDEFGNIYAIHNTNDSSKGAPGCRIQTYASYGANKINAITTLYNNEG